MNEHAQGVKHWTACLKATAAMLIHRGNATTAALTSPRERTLAEVERWSVGFFTMGTEARWPPGRVSARHEILSQRVPKSLLENGMAERVGFEPTVTLRPLRFSRPTR